MGKLNYVSPSTNNISNEAYEKPNPIREIGTYIISRYHIFGFRLAKRFI